MCIRDRSRQKRPKGIPTPGSMLVQKVKFVNDTLSFSVDFNVSGGYTIFKHGICGLSMQGEKLNGDSTRIVSEKWEIERRFGGGDWIYKKLQAFVSENQLTSEEIYNADQSRLSHSRLPSISLAAKMKKAFLGAKSAKREWVLCAANTADTHKFQLNWIIFPIQYCPAKMIHRLYKVSLTTIYVYRTKIHDMWKIYMDSNIHILIPI